MKIGLDKAALERLIGGDSEVEVELRSAVVADFTKRYLKGLVESRVFAPILQSIQESVLEEAKKQFGIKATPYRTFTLSDEMVRTVKSAVNWAVQDELGPKLTLAINTHMESMQVRGRIKEMVHALIDQEVKVQVEARVAKVLKEMK